MTLDDKKKCSELWKMASGDYIAPEHWTESAGNELAKFFAGIYDCTDAMSYVPRPCGSAPGWGWVVKQVYQVLKTRYLMNSGLVFTACKDASIIRYKSSIQIECLTN